MRLHVKIRTVVIRRRENVLKRLIAAACATVVGISMLLTANGPAMAKTMAVASSGSPLCAAGAQMLCLSNLGMFDQPIRISQEPRSPGPNQNITLKPMGKVSSSGATPFNPGSGNNATYNNDTIYEIFSDGSADCYSANLSNIAGSVYGRDCTSGGVLWVAVPTATGNRFINVFLTNHTSNTIRPLSSTGGIGDQPTTNGPQGNSWVLG